MIELLNLYHDVAKLDAGLMPLKITRLDILDLLGQVVDEQSPLAQERKIEVEVDLPAGLAAMGDLDLLRRVLQNILNNALKYSSEKGSVRITGRAEDGKVSVAFQNTGPGIAPEDLPCIFDRYYQARARRAGKLQGTGLGLTFCAEALKAMRGEITVESEPGEGAEFVVRLPAAEAMVEY